jgi:ABC-type polysaccharide/polyol phosphate export permease
MAPDFLQLIVSANPMSSFLGAMRVALLDGQAPSGSEITLMALWLSLMLMSGAWVFIRYRPRFAEEA